jgi:class 3 adenylate cyclase/DNA-binding FrmR family transcriptional regulator
MRRRSRAGGETAKTQRHKAVPRKRGNALKASVRGSPPAGQETEVAQLTRELNEALERQTATAEILKIISASPTELQSVLEVVVKSAARFCEADDVSIFEFDGQDLRSAAHWGPLPFLDIGVRFPCSRGHVAGRIVLERRPVHVIDLQAEAEEFPEGSAFAKRLGHRTILGAPLLREGVAIGTIQLRRTEVHPFTDRQIALLETFAAQAVIAIENTRLLNELRQSLEQQTATADVLRVISSSQGQLQPVFEALLANAVRLCEAKFGVLYRYDGHLFHPDALVGVPQPLVEFHQKRGAFETVPGTPLHRLWQTRDVVHTADDAAGEPPSVSARFGGARSHLAVPMFKGDALVGSVIIYRQEVRLFTDKQIELVKNFAAQAVIAIENARLLNELRERTDQLEAQSQEVLKLNQQLEQRVADQVGEIERMGRLRRFLPPQVADLIVASGTEKQLESHRREITALFCDLRGFTGFSESSDPEDVIALLRDYHAAIGKIIIKYSGTLERFAGDGVMVIFNDPVPVENPALQAVLMALDMRTAIGGMIEKWRDLGHDLGFGIGIAHGFATLGTIGFEGRFDYAAIGTVSNVASRLCDEAKPGQILISPRVRLAVDKAVTVEPVGEFTLKGIRRPMTAYNVLASSASKPN